MGAGCATGVRRLRARDRASTVRIGIDAREICGHATGAGRYLGGLPGEWPAAGRALHELILYPPAPLDPAFDSSRFTVRVVPGTPGTWWEQVHLRAAATAD